LALPPDSSDTFLREVDENLRRDQLRDMAKKYGWLLIAGLVLFLGAVGGWLYWQERQRAQAAEKSEVLAQVYTDIGAGKLTTCRPRIATSPRSAGPRSSSTRSSPSRSSPGWNRWPSRATRGSEAPAN
jgi:hypothetical protein